MNRQALNIQYQFPAAPDRRQSGVGLVEVLFAIVIFAFGALAIGNTNILSLTSIRTAEVHGNVNNIAHEMLEILKADSASAIDGLYNIGFDQAAPNGTGANIPTNLVSEWRTRLQSELPDGTGMIDCDTNSCTVSLRWRERVIPGQDTITYNVRASLAN